MNESLVLGSRERSSTSDSWKQLELFAQQDESLGRAWSEFVSSLPGKNLIDLGCGDDPYIKTWALNLRAKKYIGVDTHISQRTESEQEQYVQKDAVAFLSDPFSIEPVRKNASFLINGWEIIEDSIAQRVAQRLAAVTTVGSYVVGINSTAMVRALAEQASFKCKYAYDPNGRRFFLYQRVNPDSLN